MRNLIIVLSVFFAFSASAQTKKVGVIKAPASTVVSTQKTSPEVAAKKNIADLIAFTPITDEMKPILLELFTTKYKIISDAELSVERKSYIAEMISRKLEATLDNATFEKIKSNAVLFKNLTN